jgi:sodium-dependent phosphate transporter
VSTTNDGLKYSIIMGDQLTEYLWIAVVGTICGFFYACGIGANDVANSFASTVSSKSLTLKQAIIAAGIFEFTGAICLGAQVTSTIRSKIFNVSDYVDEPEIVLLGMFTSLFSAMIMLFVATHFGLPVSTTHTIVGAIMGFSIAAKGFDSIDWEVAKKIFVSWAVSPLVSGAIAFAFFFPLRMFVLRHENAYKRAYYTFPFVLLAGVGIDLFYILYKSTSNFKIQDDLSLGLVIPVSFGTGALCGVIWLVLVGPWAKKRVEAKLGEQGAAANSDDDLKEDIDHDVEITDKVEITEKEGDVESDEAEVKSAPLVAAPEQALQDKSMAASMRRMSQSFVENTYGQDLHEQSMAENSKAAKIWEDGEQFDPHAEQLFTYVQVFTACLNSFAHGANDVSNAIAPISAIIAIYQSGEVSSKSGVQRWILAYGGAGIVVGLFLYGYKVKRFRLLSLLGLVVGVCLSNCLFTLSSHFNFCLWLQIMKSLGFKVTMLSPSRGACAELAASLFVVTSTFLDIPVSSTQAITGAVAGVGLAGGIYNVQWFFLLRICLGWVGVFFVAVVFSAGVFSLCAFSPSLASPIGTYTPIN